MPAWIRQALGWVARCNPSVQKSQIYHLPRSSCPAPRRHHWQGQERRPDRESSPSQAKAEQEKEFAKFKKGPSPVKQASDIEMTDSESELSPSLVKKKKSKRHAKKKRRHYSSTDSETSEDDPADAKQRLADHAALAKQVYKDNLSRYKSDVVYKSLFPYLKGS